MLKMDRFKYASHFREGFTPRPQQEEAMRWLDEKMWGSSHKCKVIEAPTGCGKSLLADAIAKREQDMGRSAAIIAPSNMLLDQYIRDFPEYAFLKGKAHYDCVGFPGNSCETSKQLEKTLGVKNVCGDNKCPYDLARERCLSDYIAIFNPMSYFYFPKTIEINDKFVPRTDVLIVDEFQKVAPMLTQLFSIKIWESDIKIPKGVSGSQVGIISLLQKRLNAIYKLLRLNSANLSPSKATVLTRQSVAIEKIIKGIEHEPEEFVVDELDKDSLYGKPMRSLQVRLIRPDKKTLKQFFCAKQVVLMSATALDIDVRELGFKEFEKLNLSSPIPKEQRKIYAESIAQNSFKNEKMAMPLIIKRIKEIVNARPDERGVILTTYRQSKIMQEFLTESRYVFHDHKNKNDVIKDFITSGEQGKVAVLCGSFEGLDLKGDIARFVILPILPLPSFVDSVVKKRIDLDGAATVKEHWYEMQAMKDIMQGAGRASRNEKDYSTIHILDTKFTRAYAVCKKQLPEVFKEAIIWGRG